jgi:hypothetical protein
VGLKEPNQVGTELQCGLLICSSGLPHELLLLLLLLLLESNSVANLLF